MDVAGIFFQSISWSTSAPQRESLKDPSIQVSLVSRWSSSTCELCIVTMHIATHPLLHHHIFNVLVSLGPQETNSNHQTPIFYQAFSWMSLESTASGSPKKSKLEMLKSGVFCWNSGPTISSRSMVWSKMWKTTHITSSSFAVLVLNWHVYVYYVCVYIYIYVSKYLIQSVLDFKDKIMFPWFSWVDVAFMMAAWSCWKWQASATAP